MANTTWNPADKSATMTLSGGNLVATGTGAIAWVRAVDKKTTGKFYWELTATAWSNSNSGLGFCPSGLANPNLASGAGLCAVYATGIIFVNGTNVGTLGARSAGDIIGIALDVGAQLAWFRVAPSGNWNGSGTASPGTGVGGLSLTSITNVDDCPLAGFYPGTSESATANFGDSAFSGAVPSGFTSGWPGPTTAQVTQASLEEFITTNPPAQVTQVSLEQWASVAAYVPPVPGKGKVWVQA
jgi:hypothetical protein